MISSVLNVEDGVVSLSVTIPKRNSTYVQSTIILVLKLIKFFTNSTNHKLFILDFNRINFVIDAIYIVEIGRAHV